MSARGPRSDYKANANGQKTECLRGHPFSEENTYVTKKGRSCRACRSERVLSPSEKKLAEGLVTLDAKQIARLKDAFADGVTLDQLAARFGLDRARTAAYVHGKLSAREVEVRA